MTILVMMGVSGSGKTTVAVALAKRLGWRFQEGDDLHPPANVAKMKSGIPLTDEDRWPWLRDVAAHIDAWRKDGVNGIVACSALKRAYRDIIIGDRPDVRLVYLQGDKALLAERMASRKNHFMPASLLDSQLATLQEPGPDERPITVHVGPSVDEIVEDIVKQIGQ